MPSPAQPPLRSETLVKQVARNLRNSIDAGKLRHGDVLPSTRELAEQWGVSVFTINDAMKTLIAEGLVVTKSRSKRIVNAPDREPRQRLRPERPTAVLIGGFPGSGKTELGRILTRQSGWPMLDKDTLTRPVVEAALEILGLSPNDRESDEYFSRIRPREYESLMAAALENAQCGNSVILTAPFIREFNDDAWIVRTQALFSGLNMPVSFVWIHCDEDTMHGYMRQRGAARDASKLADWPSYLASIDLATRPTVPHHVIDNSAASPPLQAQAISLLESLAKQTL